jgi:endogenous inhibitor of DNA gyrase (YacG/DUF329 family)
LTGCRNAPMITPFKSVSRYAVEERDDGCLYVAGKLIHVSAEIAEWRATIAARRSFSRSGVPLPDRTLWLIDDALAAEAEAAGSNMRTCLSTKATRLHRCAGCGAPFVAHPSARLCSAECRTAFRRGSQRKASAKRTIRRDERRAALQVRCRQCGEPIEAPSRSSRAFCSNRCRQVSWRQARAQSAG